MRIANCAIILRWRTSSVSCLRNGPTWLPKLRVRRHQLVASPLHQLRPKLQPLHATDETDSITQKVLEIVAEKTGYPKDMLDLDLDLEADLGVDTVKQAEMFAAVRAAYNIPRDENLKLRDFPTLARVIKFARDRQPAMAKAPATRSLATQSQPEPASKESAVSESSSSKPLSRPTAASFDAANRIPRRVPTRNLRPPLALCKPTGVTLASGRRVVLMPDKSGVADSLAQRLQEMGVEVLRILGKDETLDTGALGIASKAGWPRVRYMVCTGCRRSTTRAHSRIWTSPSGTKPCGYASNRCMRPCVCCSSRSRRRTRSWYRQRDLADSTATMKLEQPRH